jgi:hypothetical protein
MYRSGFNHRPPSQSNHRPTYQNPFTPDPRVVAQFNRALDLLHSRLREANLRNVAQTALHDVKIIKVRAEVDFGEAGKSHFALEIGTSGSSNVVFACSNGSVIMADKTQWDHPKEIWNRSKEIWSYSKDRIEVFAKVKWPLALRNNIYTPLNPKIEALVLYDIVRWVDKNKMRAFSNIGKVSFPDATQLIAALREYEAVQGSRACSSTAQVSGPPRLSFLPLYIK